MSLVKEAVHTQNLFDIHGMNVWYGAHQALKDITIGFEERKVTAIIGPSGCGKSTFIKTLNLMLQMAPNVKVTGDMIYNGRNLLKEKTDAAELRKQIGMVFQKGNPFPQSIFENVVYGPRIHGEKIKRNCLKSPRNL
ncbi:phosphate transport system ATP-binding protein [Bacillus velezensis NAU-B3]|nr:phosphate transport system ATP-binding protein [Bacillus velezensis NAU-B3]